MKKAQSSSAILVSCLAVAATIVILSAGIAAAGQRFNLHKAKGGLPVCMDKLNEITANLELCNMDLTMCEENGASSSLVIGVPKTGQIISYGDRDDGDLQTGTAWPEPRFIDNEDGTVTDNMTGLVWTKNANISGETQTWDAALDACNALADDGFDLVDESEEGDWRLPNVRELQSLIDYGQNKPAMPEGHLFDAVQSLTYWTSTTYASISFSFGVSLANGNTMAAYKDNTNGVWCVRDLQ